MFFVRLKSICKELAASRKIGVFDQDFSLRLSGLEGKPVVAGKDGVVVNQAGVIVLAAVGVVTHAVGKFGDKGRDLVFAPLKGRLCGRRQRKGQSRVGVHRIFGGALAHAI